MEDLFYLSKTNINFLAIIEAAQTLGFTTRVINVEGYNFLNIYYETDRFWQWSVLSESKGDLNGFEPNARQKIKLYNPSVVFLISLHLDSLTFFMPFMKHLINKFDGWLGADDSELTECDLDKLEDCFSDGI